MIEYIKGQLTDLNPTYVVIEAAGVGYAINIALPTYSELVGKEGQESRGDGSEDAGDGEEGNRTGGESCKR